MLRVVVGELPALVVDDAVVVIGSDVMARVRLPAQAARPEHVRIEAGRWRAIGPVTVDGVTQDGGTIGDGVTLGLGTYRVRIEPAPAGAAASPVQRTESLARELMRALLGTSGAPTLEIERGLTVGAKRALAPPESILVIGRGDEAGWIILDDDLSRTHAEVRRSWDGVRIVDLDSKNGTKVDGIEVAPQGAPLRDGAMIELGNLIVRFRDPAEKHLGGPAPAAPALREVPAAAPRRASVVPFYVAVAIMLLALAGLVWIVSA